MGGVLQKAEVQFYIKIELQNTKEKATGYEKGGTETKTSCSMNSDFLVLQNALSCTYWHIIKTGNIIKLPTLEAQHEGTLQLWNIEYILTNKMSGSSSPPTSHAQNINGKRNISKNCGWILCH